MDTAKLIMLGKVEKIIEVGGITFKMASPPYSSLISARNADQTIDPVQMLCGTIIQIDDQPFITKESKAQLADLFNQMQSVIVAKLVGHSNDLIGEQDKAVEGILSKK